MHICCFKRMICLLLALFLLLPTVPVIAKEKTLEVDASKYSIVEDGSYSTMEEVAVYLSTFQKLPKNFITKNEAGELGWVSSKGNLDLVAPGCSIGGDRFGNYEKQLPDKKGRKWTECDINFSGSYRGGERIVFSNDGLIYYTNDHYNTFTKVEVVFPEESKAISVQLNLDLDEYGEYITLDEVASYVLKYGTLPCNYLTEEEAKDLGWSAKKNNLADIMPGCSIGGDVYNPKKGTLPAQKDITWYECDINSENGKRSKEKLLYSSTGLLIYTPDNGQTFISLN